MKPALIVTFLVNFVWWTILFASVQQVDAQQSLIDVGTTDCFCAVTANIDYVCGSNRVTYSNPSALECANKCTKKTITQKHRGQCS